MVAACGGFWYLEYASTWIDDVLMTSPSKLCVLEAVPAQKVAVVE